MKMGTKSLLFGAHQFIIHPVMVFIGWWRLYGFPWDPRLWLAFIVHDWGYWGKEKMDDATGETHPQWAADLMWWFGKEWYWFTLLHSRFYSRNLSKPFSRLCVADKYATVMMPTRLYLFLVKLTGEIEEYKAIEKHREDMGTTEIILTDEEWFRRFTDHMRGWCATFREVGRSVEWYIDHG